MTSKVPFARRLLLAVDAQGYGSGDDRQQSDIQTGLIAALDRAAATTGVDRAAWAKQHAGDSELAVLPPEQAEQEPSLVRDFTAALRAALAEYNTARRDEYRLRLRLAIHHGLANPDAAGYSGQGAVHVMRLVNCYQAKLALQRVPDADLVLVLSERVFSDTVAPRLSLPLRGQDFRRIAVVNKEFHADAYLHLPGVDGHALDLPETAESTRSTGTEPVTGGTIGSVPVPAGGEPTTTHYTFHGPVDVRKGTIGISNRWES